MLEKAKQIAEGWTNTIVKKDEVEEVASRRLAICADCPHHSNNAKTLKGYKSVRVDDHCTKCGCPLMSKTRCTSCECPEKKWLAEDVSSK